MPLFTGASQLSRAEVVALTNALAVALSEGLDNDDLNALGNLLSSISNLMLTFASLSPNGTATDRSASGVSDAHG